MAREIGAVDAYSDASLLDAVAGFLRHENHRLEIVVADEVDGGIEDHPLLNRLRGGDIHGRYRIAKLSAAGKKSLTAGTAGHFCVMDDHGFRLETDNLQIKAFANFGDAKAAGVLSRFFGNKLLPQSDVVAQSA